VELACVVVNVDSGHTVIQLHTLSGPDSNCVLRSQAVISSQSLSEEKEGEVVSRWVLPQVVIVAQVLSDEREGAADSN
jgi:hypothetical protein